MSTFFRTQRALLARPGSLRAVSTTPTRLYAAGTGKVPTPTMDTPEKKPDSISNSNSPPSGYAEEASKRGPPTPGANRGENKQSPASNPDSKSSANDSVPRPANGETRTSSDSPAAAGKKDLGLGKGEPIQPPDPAKGEESASVGQQEFDSDGSDKRGDLGKTA